MRVKMMLIFTWLLACSEMSSAQEVMVLNEVRRLQIVKSVGLQSSSVFNQEKNRRKDLRMQTTKFDRIPYSMYVGKYNLILKSPKKIVLAGNREGTTHWSVDNFLLFEVFDRSSGRLLRRAVVGNHDPVLAKGKPIREIGPHSFGFAAGQIDVSDLIPVNQPVSLRVSAMDYGGVGYVSDVFLTITDKPKSKPEKSE